MPLTPAILRSACPNLPSANQLLSSPSEKVGIIYPNSTTVPPQNYTEPVLGYMNGRIYPNFNVIYVTNGKVWVEIPQDALQSTGCNSALSAYESGGAATPAVTSPWAVGGYSNPLISGSSYKVTGLSSYVESTGTWSPKTANCPNSTCYIGYDVLTVWTNLYGYQLVLQNVVPGDAYTNAQGYDAVVQVWSSTGLVSSSEFSISFGTSSYYPLKIQYVASTTSWDFYYNGNLLTTVALHSGENPYMVTGNQPSAAIETDDSTQGDFSGFGSNVGWIVGPGGGSAGTCPCMVEPAISYYFNSEWNPSYTVSWPPSGSTAAAYVYDGGSLTGFAFSVGAGSPPSWIGLSSTLESMSFCVSGSSGCTTPTPAQGTKLWVQAGSEVQTNQAHNTCSTTCTTQFTVTFSNQVTKGDLLIVMVGTYTTGVTFTVSDPTTAGGQGNSWSSAISKCVNDCVQIFYATALSTSSETVTITVSSSTSYYTYGFIAEFSGAAGTLDHTSYCASSCSGNPQVSSFSPSAYSVVVDVSAVNSVGGTWTPGNGYTMIGPGNYAWSSAAEWGVYWVGSTTSPWTFTPTSTYGEVAASFK